MAYVRSISHSHRIFVVKQITQIKNRNCHAELLESLLRNKIEYTVHITGVFLNATWLHEATFNDIYEVLDKYKSIA